MAKDKKFIDCVHSLNRIREEILPLFEQAIYDSDVSYKNPHLDKCWEVLDCHSTECSIYKASSEGLRCWQAVGTYCGKVIQGDFVQKYENCKECQVFKDAVPTLTEELGEHFNNMIFLLNKQRQIIQENSKNLAKLNADLVSSFEQLDTKNREIQTLMITDKLTGLYNRHHLSRVMDDEISRHHRLNKDLIVLMADIDKFKSYNDTYGHVEGDKMLSGLGKIIASNIRKYDKAFRYGGEEFLIIFPYTNMDMAYIIADRIRKSFSETTFEINKKGKSMNVSRTISMGINILNKDHTMETFIKQADDALYQAKAMGGNTVLRYVDE
ncbi:MAG: GGDEF domain-containing protein [Nitrospirae bacterium]|nr:GGDEF domain-containing protein [Nitrospirota bacterium]MBF0540233.1 GGDEF domain-containing protein [Nitrospirota bacterium]